MQTLWGKVTGLQGRSQMAILNPYHLIERPKLVFRNQGDQRFVQRVVPVVAPARPEATILNQRFVKSAVDIPVGVAHRQYMHGSTPARFVGADSNLIAADHNRIVGIELTATDFNLGPDDGRPGMVHEVVVVARQKPRPLGRQVPALPDGFGECAFSSPVLRAFINSADGPLWGVDLYNRGVSHILC